MTDPSPIARLTEERRLFHADLLKSNVLHLRSNGNANVSDGGNDISKALGLAVLQELKAETFHEKIAPQTGGHEFEKAVEQFVSRTLKMFRPLSATAFSTTQRSRITRYHQYKPVDPKGLSKERAEALRLAFGGDYMVRPDILVERPAPSLEALNPSGLVVDPDVAELAALRAKNALILHASISCKQTMRSDRAQNARLEALNLLRTRTGRAPHIVVVTAEPFPTRIGSVALGTGDIDCTYHVALPELRAAMASLIWAPGHHANRRARARQHAELELMVTNRRLKDIADLPVDLLL